MSTRDDALSFVDKNLFLRCFARNIKCSSALAAVTTATCTHYRSSLLSLATSSSSSSLSVVVVVVGRRCRCLAVAAGGVGKHAAINDSIVSNTVQQQLVLAQL